MMIVTARLPRRRARLCLGVAAAALLCCGALTILLGRGMVPASGSAQPSPKGIKSNEDRVAYLQAWGWQVSGEDIVTQELLIPEELDESYQDYLALQSAQGFDLEKCAGKRVKRYTYEITNYPTGETGVQANLLIRKNTVVGGEIMSSQPGGFLHGLAMP